MVIIYLSLNFLTSILIFWLTLTSSMTVVL
jgi:hypothetical protein